MPIWQSLRESTERLQGKECLLEESRPGQKWSGPSMATVFGNKPEKNAQEKCGSKAVYLTAHCPAHSLGVVQGVHIWLPQLWTHWIGSPHSQTLLCIFQTLGCIPLLTPGFPGLFASPNFLTDGAPNSTVSTDAASTEPFLLSAARAALVCYGNLGALSFWPLAALWRSENNYLVKMVS